MTLPARALAQYAILALPLAFSGLPLFIYAPDYYTGQYGVSLGVMGVILLVIRALDAVQDPLIGSLCDRYAARRVPILGIALGLLGAGFFMLYHPLAAAPTLWFTLSMILATFAFSVLSINLNAIGSLWRSDTAAKTAITATREAIGLVGLMTATILPSVLQQQGMSVTATYNVYALCFLVCLLLTGGIFLRWCRRQPFVSQAESGHPSLWNFAALRHPVFRSFFLTYGLSMLASSIPAVLVLFFIRERLGAEDLTGPFLLVYFAAGIAGMPLWKYVSGKIGLEKSWLAGMGLAITTFGFAFLLRQGDVWPYAAICITSGLALSAELSLPPALLSRLIGEQNRTAETSSFFAWMIFLTKAMLAIATGVSFLLLDQAGFVPHQENTAAALLTLSALYALAPCICKMLAALVLWRSLRLSPQLRTDA